MEYFQLESKLNALEEAVKTHRKSLDDINKIIDVEKGGLSALISGVDKIPAVEFPVAPIPKIPEAEECSAAVGLGLQAKSDVNVSWNAFRLISCWIYEAGPFFLRLELGIKKEDFEIELFFYRCCMCTNYSNSIIPTAEHGSRDGKFKSMLVDLLLKISSKYLLFLTHTMTQVIYVVSYQVNRR